MSAQPNSFLPFVDTIAILYLMCQYGTYSCQEGYNAWHIPLSRDVSYIILIFLYHIRLYWGPLQTTPLLVNFRASHDSLDIWHHVGLLPTIILVINDCRQTILYVEGGFMSSQALLSRSNLSWNVLYHCMQTAMEQRNPISPLMLHCDDAHHACLVDCCNLHIIVPSFLYIRT